MDPRLATALLAGPIGGLAAMAFVWLALGLDGDRGLGDVRVFMVGALVAGCVTTVVARRRSTIGAAVGWGLASATVLFGLLFLLLVISVMWSGSPGPAN